MEVTLMDIVNVRPVVESIMGQKLPAKTSFRMVYFVNSVNPILETISKIQRDLFEKYAITGKAEAKQVPPDKLGDFQAELSELLNEKIVISTPLTMDLFENITITPTEAVTLLPFMEVSHGNPDGGS